jgi:hypothetical protein
MEVLMETPRFGAGTAGAFVAALLLVLQLQLAAAPVAQLV